MRVAISCCPCNAGAAPNRHFTVAPDHTSLYGASFAHKRGMPEKSPHGKTGRPISLEKKIGKRKSSARSRDAKWARRARVFVMGGRLLVFLPPCFFGRHPAFLFCSVCAAKKCASYLGKCCACLLVRDRQKKSLPNLFSQECAQKNDTTNRMSTCPIPLFHCWNRREGDKGKKTFGHGKSRPRAGSRPSR